MARANDEDGEVNFQVDGSGVSWFGFQAMPAKHDILLAFFKANRKLCALEFLYLCLWPLGQHPSQQVAAGGGCAAICDRVVVAQNSKLKKNSNNQGFTPLCYILPCVWWG